MNKVTYAASTALLVAGAFVAGSWYNQSPSGAAAASSSGADAEHAAHIAAGHVHGGSVAAPTDGSAPAGLTYISPERQQLIGVQLRAAERMAGTRTLRLLGRVAADEARVYRIITGIAGSIHEVAPITTGSRVKKNQMLASYVSPDALPAIQLFMLNVSAMDRSQLTAMDGHDAASLASANLRQRMDQLENLGVSMEQLKEIADSQVFPESLRLVSPTDGVILSRNLTMGMKFEKGMELFQIADLRKVWITADVFENEAYALQPGTRVSFNIPGQNKTYSATVAAVLPRFDATSRTMKVRLEADNPDGLLLPDMFVDLKVSVPYAPSIVVPADALLDTGMKKIIFVESGAGMFAPRDVETGWRFDNQVEIVNGIVPGDRIVTSGTFLLESETRMKHPASRLVTVEPVGKGSAPKAMAEPVEAMPQMDHSHHH